MCLYPKIIKNKKYTRTEKNGGVIPSVTDQRTQWVPVGCENCIECRKQKARQWQVRLLEDIKTNTNGKFITLTFSNESIKHLTEEAYKQNEQKISKLYGNIELNSLPKNLKGYELDNAIATLAMRRFNERWRKEHGKAIRHWMVTELGHNGTENIHLHGIIWTDKPIETIRRIWNYGYIWPRPDTVKKTYVNEQTINYIIKYITKKDDKHTQYKGIVLTSPGIGKNYINNPNINKNKFNGKQTDETYRTKSGHKVALPIYYRNKIYTEQQKEQLWIQKLDKEERYICGEKIDISNGDKIYYETLQHYRIINQQLGYGTDEKDWKKHQYENARREMLQKTRIENTK